MSTKTSTLGVRLPVKTSKTDSPDLRGSRAGRPAICWRNMQKRSRASTVFFAILNFVIHTAWPHGLRRRNTFPRSWLIQDLVADNKGDIRKTAKVHGWPENESASGRQLRNGLPGRNKTADRTGPAYDRTDASRTERGLKCCGCLLMRTCRQR